MSRFSGIRNFLPSITWNNNRSGKGHRIPIAAFQFTRLKHDIADWRAAIGEAEQAFYPHRVKLQRIYMDTVLNSHVFACIERRNDLTLLKDFGFYSGETLNEDVTALFKKKWFFEFIKHALEAKLYGYSLIQLGDIVNNEFPELSLFPRENISPDREMAAPLVYQVHGEHFTDPSNEYHDWTVWIPTPTDKGTSTCGYGLLYKVANLEIFLRNTISANASYNDKYGQPMRHAKTTKLEGKEYDELCKAMDEFGENFWMVTDHNDVVELIAAEGGKSAGFKTYENFDARLEKKISKVILGHADALDSTPGKLGGGQDGEESPAGKALEDIETKDARDIEHIVNACLIPKLLSLGFPVPPGLEFRFKNDKEKEEIRERQDKSLQATAEAVKTLGEAGWEVDEKWINEHTGIKITKKEMPAPLVPGAGDEDQPDPKLKEKLKNLYKEV